MDANKNIAREQIIPPGFTLGRATGDIFVINHIRVGMGCRNTFLIVWLAGWSFGCVFLNLSYLNSVKMKNGQAIPLWAVLLFWAAELLVACYLTYFLFCKKTFRADAACLRVDTNVLGIGWSKSIPKSAIKRFVQVKDGGKSLEDNFPSWGLWVEAGKKTTLLSRQPYEKSQWLGRVLSKWAHVEFIEATRP